MIRYLGFTPVDCGTIRNAREIEDIPVQRFPYWKIPMIISTLIFGSTYYIAFLFLFFLNSSILIYFSLVFYLAIWKIQHVRLDPR